MSCLPLREPLLVSLGEGGMPLRGSWWRWRVLAGPPREGMPAAKPPPWWCLPLPGSCLPRSVSISRTVAVVGAPALRRLADFLQHGHPLQLLAFLQSDVRRRSFAAAAPDYDTFLDWDGGRAGWALEKVWKQRSRIKGSDLKLALGALARADLQLKTAPEATHRVTMERLTVAMCRWYGGARRR